MRSPAVRVRVQVPVGDLEPNPGRQALARHLGARAALFTTCRKEKVRSGQAGRGVAGTHPVPPHPPPYLLCSP